MTTRTVPILLAAALLAAPFAAHSDEPENFDALLPIPAEATPEQKEEFDEVIATARATDVSVTESNAILYHGLELVQDEEYEEAIPFLEEALRRDPSLQSGWEGLGWANVKLGRLQRARTMWLYFRRLMPQETLPHALLAQAAILDTDWLAADQHFRDAIATGGASYDVRFWYAQNLMRLGRTADAEKAMRKLVEENPDRLDVQIDLGSLLNQRLAYDEAVEIYRRINDELPGNPRFMLEQALLETRVGELERADAICLDVLEIDPDNAMAMSLRADIAEIAGQDDVGPFLQIIDETKDPVVRANLRVRLANRCHVMNQLETGHYEESFILDLLDKAIQDDPDSVDNKLLYAERLLEAGYSVKCRAIVVDVLENYNRHNARAKMFLFELALKERRFEDARQILADRFGAFDPTDPMLHWYKSRLYVAEGSYTEALTELDLLEAAATKGCVLTLEYHGLTESDWSPSTSVRRLHEHIVSLQREGWTLISPADIPSLLTLPEGESRPFAEKEEEPPATARFFDWLRWVVTGHRRFAPRTAKEESPPSRLFAVTFDGDQRSSLILGTAVAEEFGVPFAIFTQTEPADEFVPSRAGWHELREAVASGAWIVGSQLHSAYKEAAIDPEGKDLRSPLPNRLWLPEKNRRESMNEWDRRMRREFQESIAVLNREMGEHAPEVPMVAYPFGDIGQDRACNLSTLRNPSQPILSEAAREYRLGFLPSPNGFTVAGDNLLIARRWEPPWVAEGPDVVRHAYEFHPVFLARRTRFQVAMLMYRPNLANHTLDLLRRDGYPEDLCRAMERELHAHFRNRPHHDVRPLLATDKNSGGVDVPADGPSPEEEEEDIDARRASAQPGTATLTESTPDPLFEPDNFRISVAATHAKANDQVELAKAEISAGLDLNRNTMLDARYEYATLKQTVVPRWNAVASTNVPYAMSKYKFRTQEETAAVTLNHRTEGGATLTASGGMIARSPKRMPGDLININLQDDLNSHHFEAPEDEHTWYLALGARWNPRDNLTLSFDYLHNYVLSAVKNIEAHTVGAGTEWLPEDDLHVSAGARYSTYEDDNALYTAHLDAFWETNPDLGIWLGLMLSTATSSDPCDYYWTPYWDHRAMGVLRYIQRWEGYSFRLDLLGGFHCSAARPTRYVDGYEEEEKVVYTNDVANTVIKQKLVKVPIEDEKTDWSLAWGVDAQYEKTLTETASIIISGSVTALHEYIDHNFTIRLRFEF